MILSCVGGLFLQLEALGPGTKLRSIAQGGHGDPGGFLAGILGRHSFQVGRRSGGRGPPIARFCGPSAKLPALDTIAAASEQFRRSPLVAVFDFGYSEVARQMKSRGSVTNPLALERT